MLDRRSLLSSKKCGGRAVCLPLLTLWSGDSLSVIRPINVVLLVAGTVIALAVIAKIDRGTKRVAREKQIQQQQGSAIVD